MLRNPVKERLKEGKPSIGTWLSLGSPVAAKFVARLGFDWVTVDTEHNPIDWEKASQMFLACCGTSTIPLCRIPWNTGENIKRALDNGAWGIVVPMCCSRAEAESAVAGAKYPPLGERSVGGNLHAVSFNTDPATYYAYANEVTLVILQIEHIRAVEKAEEILSVPGVDAVFIGPNDLLSSMGKKPQMETDDPAFVQALDYVLKTAQKYGVTPGIHVANAEMANRRIAQGFRFIALASELALMTRGLTTELNQIQGWGKEGKEVARY